jgi:hypothetical protein
MWGADADTANPLQDVYLANLKEFGKYLKGVSPKTMLLHIFSTEVDIPFTVILKVKESRNRPGVAQRVPGGLGSQIS